LEGVSSWERRYIELGNFKNWIAYMGGIGSSSGRKMPATCTVYLNNIFHKHVKELENDIVLKILAHKISLMARNEYNMTSF
jgi:hypothetical protein